MLLKRYKLKVLFEIIQKCDYLHVEIPYKTHGNRHRIITVMVIHLYCYGVNVLITVRVIRLQVLFTRYYDYGARRIVYRLKYYNIFREYRLC